MSTVSKFETFKNDLQHLWRDISDSCKECQFPDCMGYISVMPSERITLMQDGFRLMQINGRQGPTFIDNYPRNDLGEAIVGTLKPLCPYRSADGGCSKHSNKPMLCDMYPLGIEFKQGSPWWVLYQDCEHIHRIQQKGLLNKTKREVRNLTKKLTNDQLEEITTTFLQASELASWPDGPNRVILVERITA